MKVFIKGQDLCIRTGLRVFGYSDAASDGSYDAHASLFPDFDKFLDELVEEGIIVKRSGPRYTGPTNYFEVNTSREIVLNALSELYIF